MIFSRALRREFTRAALMALLVLMSILLTVTVVKLLGMAAGGTLSGDAVVAMLAFGALTYLPVILSASVFTALLISLSRAYRDSEMIIWLSSGISLSRFGRPVLRFAIPMALVVALMSLLVSPWAIGKRSDYQTRLDSRDETAQITPGVFRESRQSDQVFFVDALSTNKDTVSNVFVQSVQEHKVGVIAADKGFATTYPNGDRFIVLQRGRRYEGEPGTKNYTLVDFERAELRIDQKGVSAAALSVKSMSLPQLLTHPTLDGWGEIHWRIGLPVSLLVLSLFSIPLSYVNARGGRSTNMILALLTYMVYYNTMSIAQAWVVQGRLSPAVGIWPVHLTFLVLALLLLKRRQWVFSLRWAMQQWRQRRTPSDSAVPPLQRMKSD